jgi:hypothetical protein
MSLLDDCRASLRITGDDLEPNEVTRLLGCQPSEAWEKGQPMPGRARAPRANTGGWLLRSDLPKLSELEAKIQNILDRITDDREAWLAIHNRFRADIFCGLFMHEMNQGFELSPSILRRLADRGLKIGFDIYADCSDDQTEMSQDS